MVTAVILMVTVQVARAIQPLQRLVFGLLAIVMILTLVIMVQPVRVIQVNAPGLRLWMATAIALLPMNQAATVQADAPGTTPVLAMIQIAVIKLLANRPCQPAGEHGAILLIATTVIVQIRQAAKQLLYNAPALGWLADMQVMPLMQQAM